VSVDRSFVERNRVARERLERVIARLSDDDVRRPLGEGWTVATSLVHLAFWDRRADVLLGKWQKEGIRPSPADTDVINDAVLIQSRLIPPHAAADEAVAAARAVDEKLEALSSEMLAAILEAGSPMRLDRATHRHEHLDEIERVLDGAG